MLLFGLHQHFVECKKGEADCVSTGGRQTVGMEVSCSHRGGGMLVGDRPKGPFLHRISVAAMRRGDPLHPGKGGCWRLEPISIHPRETLPVRPPSGESDGRRDATSSVWTGIFTWRRRRFAWRRLLAACTSEQVGTGCGQGQDRGGT